MGRKRREGGDLLPGYEGVGKRKEKENPNRKESGKKGKRLKYPEKGSGSLSATLFLVRCWFFCDLPLGRRERLSFSPSFRRRRPLRPSATRQSFLPFFLSFFFEDVGGSEELRWQKGSESGRGALLRERLGNFRLAPDPPTKLKERRPPAARPPATPATLVYAIPPSLPLWLCLPLKKGRDVHFFKRAVIMRQRLGNQV